MRERQILFSDPMVRAILEDRKTQTRRVVKPQPVQDQYGFWSNDGKCHCGSIELWAETAALRCKHGQPGDRLWVREAWMDLSGTGIEKSTGDRSRYAYRADTPPGSYGDEARKGYGLKWRPSIHMPRSASRILLEIVAVRVERLNDISEADARAEGSPPGHPSIDRVSREFGFADFPRSWFGQLWESINGPGSWTSNPWVWVIEFKKLAAGDTATQGAA